MYCPKCEKIFTSSDIGTYSNIPFILKCGHNICQKCLKSFSFTKSNGIACTVCDEITISDAEIYPNYYAIGAFSKIAKQLVPDPNLDKVVTIVSPTKKRSETLVSCDECSTPAKWSCLACTGVYCQACFEKVHKASKSLRRHKKEPLHDEHLAHTMLQDGCPLHDQKLYEFFCETDGELACSYCVAMGNHKEHPVKPLIEKNSSSLEELKGLKKEGCKVRKKIQTNQKKLQEVFLPKLQNKYNCQRIAISARFHHLHSILQRRELELMEELKSHYVDQATHLKNKIKEMDGQVKQLTYLLADAEAVIKTPLVSINIITLLKKLKDFVETPNNLIPLDSSNGLKVTIANDIEESIRSVGTLEGSLTPSFEFKLDEETPEEYRLDIQSDEEDFLLPKRSTTVSSSDGSSLPNSSSTESIIPCNQKRPAQFSKILNCQEVRVCHIRNPGQFWVQRESDQHKIASLRSSIHQHIVKHKNSLTAPTLSSIKIGELYLAKCSIDSTWYRASIKSIISKPSASVPEEDSVGMVEVYYLDFGNSEILSVANMRDMDEQFKSTPPLALECSLYHILPLHNDCWNEESTTLFAQFVSDKKLQIKIIDVIDEMYFVDLSQLPNASILDDTPVSVRDALVFLGLAKLSSGDLKWQKPKPYLDHSKKRRHYYNPESMAPNQMYSTIISHMNNPHDFFVQQLGNSARYLAQLFHTLQERYNDNDQNGNLLVFSPYVGMPCVGKFTLDNQWYRALVIDIEGPDRVKVKYVDFGNSEKLPYTHLRKITDDLMKLPAQAINCSLVDIDPPPSPLSDENSKPSKWNDEAKDFILEWVKGKKLVIIVHRVDLTKNKNEVSLYERVDDHDVCLGALLVKENLAISTGPLSSELHIFRASRDRPHATSTSVSSHAPFVQNGVPRQTPRSPPKKPEKSPAITYIPVYVSHCEDPSNIFVQYASEEEQKNLKNLQDSLQGLFAAPSSESLDVNITPSAFYVVYHPEDEKWYRGQLLKDLGNDTYKIKLIDFGLVIEVPKSSLQTLPPSFASKEAMATKCHIADISPAGGSQEWSHIASEHTSFFIRQYTSFLLDIKGGKINGSLPIDLLIKEDKMPGPLEPVKPTYLSLKDVLLEKGLALPRKRKECSGTRDLDKSQDTVPKWKPAETPPAMKFRGLVMHVDYEGFFYIQMGEKQDQVEKILRVLNEKYEESDNLNEPKENGETDKEKMSISDKSEENSSEDTASLSPTPENPKNQREKDAEPSLRVGQAVIAKFPVDNKWYRAEVSAFHNDGVEVLFVDYGNNYLAPDTKKDIRTDICMEDIPRLCYKCELWNLIPITENGLWPVDMLNIFHKMTVETLCEVIIMEPPVEGSPLKVVLNLSNNTSFHDFLIKGFKIATYRDPMLVDDDEDEDYLPLDISEEADQDPFPVVVTQILNSNILFIQRLPPDDELRPNSKAVLENFEKFLEMLKALDEEASTFPPLADLKIGKPCCSIFDDGKWYRSHILSVEEETAHVLYVDYGNAATVPLDKVREIPSKFLEFPAQAIRCKLHNILPSSEPADAIYALKAKLISSETTLYAKVVVPSQVPEIEIFKKDGTLAYQDLIYNNILHQEQ